jgi:hypothetical protein
VSRDGVFRDRRVRLISSAKVIEQLTPVGVTLPTSEYQCRPLAKLPPEKRLDTWREILETAPEGNVTATHVQAKVDAVVEVDRLEADRNYRYHRAKKMLAAAIADDIKIPKRDGAAAIFRHWERKRKRSLSDREKALLRDDVSEFCRQHWETEKLCGFKSDESLSENQGALTEEEIQGIVAYLLDFSPSETIVILQRMPPEYQTEFAKTKWQENPTEVLK